MVHTNKQPHSKYYAANTRVVIFPGWQKIPGNTGKYREIWEIPGNIKVCTNKY